MELAASIENYVNCKLTKLASQKSARYQDEKFCPFTLLCIAASKKSTHSPLHPHHPPSTTKLQELRTPSRVSLTGQKSHRDILSPRITLQTGTYVGTTKYSRSICSPELFMVCFAIRLNGKTNHVLPTSTGEPGNRNSNGLPESKFYIHNTRLVQVVSFV